MRRRRGFIMAIAPLLLSALMACRERPSGTITGTVIDGAKARVPDAIVMVVNQGTDASTGVKTNALGEYTTPPLPAGKYTVLVRKEGFRSDLKSGVGVGLLRTVRVDLQLIAERSEPAIDIKTSGSR